MSPAKKKSMVSLIISFLSLVALTSGTYAWMTITKSPSVTDLSLTVITDNALELAPDIDGVPGEWSSIMDLSAVFEDMVPLKPVTYSLKQNAFMAPRYGWDGRPDFTDPILLEDEGNEYYIALDFWIRAGSTECAIQLTPPVEDGSGKLGGGTYVVGEPVWDDQAKHHKDSGNGVEDAVRMGFRVAYKDADGNPTGKEKFAVYEPNADRHKDGNGYHITASIDGEGSLVSEENLILQEASTWKEASPVLKDTVLYDLGSFITDNTTLFTLRAQEQEKVTLYIWLEGQDSDCSNSISAGRAMGNLQFKAVENGDANRIVPR